MVEPGDVAIEMVAETGLPQPGLSPAADTGRCIIDAGVIDDTTADAQRQVLTDPNLVSLIFCQLVAQAAKMVLAGGTNRQWNSVSEIVWLATQEKSVGAFARDNVLEPLANRLKRYVHSWPESYGPLNPRRATVDRWGLDWCCDESGIHRFAWYIAWLVRILIVTQVGFFCVGADEDTFSSGRLMLGSIPLLAPILLAGCCTLPLLCFGCTEECHLSSTVDATERRIDEVRKVLERVWQVPAGKFEPQFEPERDEVPGQQKDDQEDNADAAEMDDESNPDKFGELHRIQRTSSDGTRKRTQQLVDRVWHDATRIISNAQHYNAKRVWQWILVYHTLGAALSGFLATCKAGESGGAGLGVAPDMPYTVVMAPLSVPGALLLWAQRPASIQRFFHYDQTWGKWFNFCGLFLFPCLLWMSQLLLIAARVDGYVGWSWHRVFAPLWIILAPIDLMIVAGASYNILQMLLVTRVCCPGPTCERVHRQQCAALNACENGYCQNLQCCESCCQSCYETVLPTRCCRDSFYSNTHIQEFDPMNAMGTCGTMLCGFQSESLQKNWCFPIHSVCDRTEACWIAVQLVVTIPCCWGCPSFVALCGPCPTLWLLFGGTGLAAMACGMGPSFALLYVASMLESGDIIGQKEILGGIDAPYIFCMLALGVAVPLLSLVGGIAAFLSMLEDDD